MRENRLQKGVREMDHKEIRVTFFNIFSGKNIHTKNFRVNINEGENALIDRVRQYVEHNSQYSLQNDIDYDFEFENGVKWFRVNYLSFCMRKTCAFRMIGKALYYRPLKEKVYNR